MNIVVRLFIVGMTVVGVGGTTQLAGSPGGSQQPAPRRIGRVTLPVPSQDASSGVDPQTQRFLDMSPTPGVRGWTVFSTDPTSHRLYVGGADGLFWVDLGTATLEGPLHPIRIVGAVEAVPALKTVFVEARDGEIVAISTETGELRRVGQVDQMLHRVIYGRTRQEVYVPFMNGIAVFDAVSGERKPGLRYPWAAAGSFVESGGRLYQMGPGEPARLSVLDAATGTVEEIALGGVRGDVVSLIPDHDGHLILVHEGGLSVLDLSTGLTKPPLGVPRPQTTAFDASSRTLIAAWQYVSGITRVGTFHVGDNGLVEDGWFDLPLKGPHRILGAAGNLAIAPLRSREIDVWQLIRK